MKVLLFNGSPRREGCTYTALSEMAAQFAKYGIETEIFQAVADGATDIDNINAAIEKVKTADAFVFGSPVYYASPNGDMLAFMDRLFAKAGALFAYKSGACIASARRAGTTATVDALGKYLGISKMITVNSNYWNMVHGDKPDEVRRDAEGLQIMRTLADNMAWVMKLIENGKAQGINPPEAEPKIKTNFIDPIA